MRQWRHHVRTVPKAHEHQTWQIGASTAPPARQAPHPVYALAQSRADADPEELVRHAWTLFDRDRDGFISQKEMRAALSSFSGISLTEKEVERVIAEAMITFSGDQKK